LKKKSQSPLDVPATEPHEEPVCACEACLPRLADHVAVHIRREDKDSTCARSLLFLTNEKGKNRFGCLEIRHAPNGCNYSTEFLSAMTTWFSDSQELRQHLKLAVPTPTSIEAEFALLVDFWLRGCNLKLEDDQPQHYTDRPVQMRHDPNKSRKHEKFRGRELALARRR